MTQQHAGIVPDEEAGSLSASEGSRALVAQVRIAGEATGRGMTLARAAAPFVAQLIATAANTPQTRVLRRAAPRDAVDAYGRGPKMAADRPHHGTSISRLF